MMSDECGQILNQCTESNCQTINGYPQHFSLDRTRCHLPVHILRKSAVPSNFDAPIFPKMKILFKTAARTDCVFALQGLQCSSGQADIIRRIRHPPHLWQERACATTFNPHSAIPKTRQEAFQSEKMSFSDTCSSTL